MPYLISLKVYTHTHTHTHTHTERERDIFDSVAEKLVAETDMF